MTGRARWMTPRRAVAVGALLLGVLGAGVWGWRRAARAPVDAPAEISRRVRAPEGVRIRIEVLNATRTRGLARRATHFLRDRGFDVVAIGTTGAQQDSTVVLDRSGHPEWARLVSEAMGGARVEARPDTSRYVDLTVLIGRSWRPPAEALYP